MIRRAYICNHKDHTVPVRKFIQAGEPEPRCEKHGKMQPQKNNPYKGEAKDA